MKWLVALISEFAAYALGGVLFTLVVILHIVASVLYGKALP